MILVDTSIWIDHLLAAVRLTPPARLATRDKRLHKAAERLGLGQSLV